MFIYSLYFVCVTNSLYVLIVLMYNKYIRHRVLSRPLSNTMGVFQGSVLGPLLFTIFSCNLSLYAGDAEVFQYADDTQD